MLKKLFLFALTVIFFCGHWVSLQAAGTRGVLAGTIREIKTGKSVERAFITAQGVDETYTATADSNGFFSITGVLTGVYTVTVERIGYHFSVSKNVLVTADSTTHLTFEMRSEAVPLSGMEVNALRLSSVIPSGPLTNYGYSYQETQTLFPGVANLKLQSIYETLPGVSLGFDPYYSGQSSSVYGGAVPHIRGGLGNDVGYAFDGVPISQDLLIAVPGTNLTNVGTLRTDFYVGSYPTQYGNFLSGWINQVAKRGHGPFHVNLQVEYGSWFDLGRRLPNYDTRTGTVATYNGASSYNPTAINLEASGQLDRFGYYFNHIIQDQGVVPYPAGVDLKPLVNEFSWLLNSTQRRDSVLNLTYDLNPNNGLQLLLYEGIQKFNVAGFQELPCNPSNFNYPAGSCLGGNTGTGFSETFNAFQLSPLLNTRQESFFDLEKFEWTHHFNDPGSILSVRLWRYNPGSYSNNFDQPSTFWAFQRSANSGMWVEHQHQITPAHLTNLGADFMYSKNVYSSAFNNIGAPASPSGQYYNAAQAVLYNAQNPPGVSNIIQVPDTQSWSAWINDEWRPTPKWLLEAGLRWDKENYLLLGRSGVVTNANGLPFVVSSLCSNGILCADPARVHPSFIFPRFGVSYNFSNRLTMSSGYGKFITFAPAARVESVRYSSATAGSSVYLPGYPANTPASFQLAGSKPQIGESLDVSWTYQLDNHTTLKLTPYVKHIRDPLQNTIINGQPATTNAGVVGSKGIELFLKSQNEHGLSGWLSYTFSSTRGSQLPFETDLSSSIVGKSGSPFSLPQVISDGTQMVPTAYDQRHVLNLVLNYKIGKWEIAPNFSYGSGYPYGLGAQQLRALVGLMDPNSVINGGGTAVPGNSSAINPRGETSFNSLRGSGWWLGNLAISYHFNPDFSAILNVFNLWNSHQIVDYDNTVFSGIGYAELTNPNSACCYTSSDSTKNILPQYNPNNGVYAPIAFPSLRQFYLTLQYQY